eukprot:8739259-Prorocentrum_lima.AAC.1
MTSSLVGSEMCIRDSARSVALCARTRVLRGRWWLRGGPASGNGGAHWPVSYTHLTLPTICSV